MTDLLTRLQAALGAAYRVEKELGGGGMSRVFLAEEQELGRRVVIKVLPPEVAAGVNLDRFRREIHLAASLQHPHIVPLLTAGHVQEVLYYTMPLIEGESLRAKLAREGALPVADAVRIMRDVVDALAYAHRRGVVHRDIKPDNVLISDHHAVVTDFGVAKALSEATGASSLTSAGVALGTPAYMAPEQAAADPHADHRCDIYAVGALAYEMLTGRPPFTGGTPQQVLAAQVSEAPAPVAKHRATVPPGLAESVMRCLEKNPADRWQSADELLHQLEAMVTPSGGTQPVPAVRWKSKPGRWALVSGVAVVVVLGALLWRRSRPSEVPVDPKLVAVFPFRVAGADRSLAYLREGMVDLLATVLTGEGGPRAADPRTVLSAWRRVAASEEEDLPQDAALGVARRLGAGQVVLGGAVGTPGHLVLSASLLRVAGGTLGAQARVEGPADSLPALVDRLTARLLAAGAGEEEQRVANLTTASLPALRAYLEGRAAYRRGQYRDARSDFERAVQLDSTFVLAAMALSEGFIVSRQAARWLTVAWAGRERLGVRDRAFLEAYTGPRYPVLPRVPERIAAWERATVLAPDRAEAWWELGDALYHDGPQIGLADSRERAGASFRRALQLDSGFVAPLEHLVELAAAANDTASVRRLGAVYLRVDSAGDLADFVRWRVAISLADSAALAALRGRLDRLRIASLERVVGVAQLDGVGLEDGDRAAGLVLDRSADALGGSSWRLAQLALNRGRPAAALRALEAGVPADSGARQGGGAAREPILDALYGDGDTVAAVQAFARLARRADAPLAPGRAERETQYGDMCVVQLWRLARRDQRTAPQVIARLRGSLAPRDSVTTVANNAVCATILDAIWAAQTGRSDAAASLSRLDSVMRTDPWGSVVSPLVSSGDWIWGLGNLVVARLREARGDLPGALAAVRRRAYDWSNTQYLATFLRGEGRLAALTGGRAGAIRAYQHYLALRSDPEPSVKPEVDQVRAELAKLVGEGGTAVGR